MKTPIRRLDSLTHNDTAATKLINDNFEALQQGVEDALSRSGKKPNFMDDVLDMNMHRIINIADPVDDYDLANKHYVDTKVAEEETRARAAEEDEETARIAGDNALRGLIDDEKAARIAADNALRDAIDSGISLTPIILDQVWLENDSAEPVSHILIDLTNDYGVTYDVNKSYIPVVVIYTPEFAQYISYVRVIKLSTGYQLDVHTPHNVYIPASLNSNSSVVLIPVNSVIGEIYYYGAVNNVGTGGGSGSDDKSIYLKNQTMTFAVNSGNAFLDVSNYVENDVAYCPIVFIHAADESITPHATYNVTNKYVYLTRNSAYADVQKTVTVDVCLIPVDTNETDINGLSNGLYYAQYLFINKSDIATNISSSSTDTQVPSAKCVYDIVGNIETLLQSI